MLAQFEVPGQDFAIRERHQSLSPHQTQHGNALCCQLNEFRHWLPAFLPAKGQRIDYQ